MLAFRELADRSRALAALHRQEASLRRAYTRAYEQLKTLKRTNPAAPLLNTQPPLLE
jgi:hypothetical protein